MFLIFLHTVLPSGERMALPNNESRIILPAYSMLNIRDTRKTDSGIYACVAENLYGYTQNLTEIVVLGMCLLYDIGEGGGIVKELILLYWSLVYMKLNLSICVCVCLFLCKLEVKFIVIVTA